ncbi:MAG: major capsid family protein, partial [Limisphaerales bacterium]
MNHATQRPLVKAVRTAVHDHAYAPGLSLRPAFSPRGMMTFDNMHGGYIRDSKGRMNAPGVHFGQQFLTHDGRVVDSTGAFLVGELERLDMKMHEPLMEVSWSRDIELREDVTIADDVSSFTLSSYGSAGGIGNDPVTGGKAWVEKSTNQISGVSVDIGKTPHPLHPWALEIKYSVLELESSARLGRPIDQQKYTGLQLKHQRDINAMVYIGDTDKSAVGLLNQPNTAVSTTNAPNGNLGSPLWAQKSPTEILADVNAILSNTWKASGYAVMPDWLLIPPNNYSQLSSQIVSVAGNQSVLKYLLENNLLTTSTGGKLNIFPQKYLVGAGAGGTIGTDGTHNRMVAYFKNYDKVRYPMTLLQRTPLQYDSIYQKTT